MKTRMLLLAMLPCLLVVGCGTEPETKESVRAIPVDPCQPDDCGPQDPIENGCPDGTEPIHTSECVDQDGECVWQVTEDCIPVDDSTGGHEPPPPEDVPPPPPPSEQPPRPIRPV